MSSFGEKKAVQFAKEQGRQFVEFTRRQLARIYPAGLAHRLIQLRPCSFVERWMSTG